MTLTFGRFLPSILTISQKWYEMGHYYHRRLTVSQTVQFLVALSDIQGHLHIISVHMYTHTVKVIVPSYT